MEFIKEIYYMPRNPSFNEQVTLRTDLPLETFYNKYVQPTISDYLSQFIKELLSYLEFQILCEIPTEHILEDYELNRILKQAIEKKIQKKYFDYFLFQELKNFTIFNINQDYHRLTNINNNFEKTIFHHSYCLDLLNRVENDKIQSKLLICNQQTDTLSFIRKKIKLNKNYSYSINFKHFSISPFRKVKLSDKNKIAAINNHSLDINKYDDDLIYLEISQMRLLIKELIDA
ncbi:hypothetical protein PTQ21_27905 [Paenibacillus marchantiae]|uniref:hypothetical protein n=1 Tax=Paenibacillus marchantiae TaxID=3026433 RepID=UPI00237B612D|nr:hypothetical protein [Paenibacillus marchantiae]WDQ32161.1 hypothetical protein PTQ21_27905 [Paenibacillus marchantiae]